MSDQKKTVIILAALDLASDQAWNHITLSHIAAKSKITLAELHDIFEDKSDILTAFGRMIDRQVLANIGTPTETETTSSRDILFDLIMDRFEALNTYRAGVLSIIKSFKCDPKDSLTCAPSLCRSMGWMLEAAHISTHGLGGIVKISAFSALYLKTARVWVKDESTDMGKTMAELDKNLATAEVWAQRLSLNRK